MLLLDPMKATGVPRDQQNTLLAVVASWWPLLLLLVIWIPYSALFIWKTSFLIDGARYFGLFDDSMVSMTFARNLAHGNGAVWNAGGERVEGFSNPLWVGIMALIHILPVPRAETSLVVQVIGALLLIGTLATVKLVAERVIHGDRFAVWATVLLVAFYYPLVNWGLLGTEVSAMALVTTVSALLAMKVLDEGRGILALYLVLGIGTLVRLDGSVAFVAILGMLMVLDSGRRRAHALAGVGSLFIFLGGQTLLRRAYFGDWLPNTYYLKMTGSPVLPRMERGWDVFIDFIRSLKWPLALTPLLALLRRGQKKRWLLAGVIAAEMAYSIYIGGDAWEARGGANRFIAPVMPLFMTLFMVAWCEVRRLGARTLVRFGQGLRGTRWPDALTARLAKSLGTAGMVLVTGVSLLYFNRLVDAGSLRADLKDLAGGRLRYALLLERSIFVPGTERYAKDALVVCEVTTPDATVALVAAGNTPYFCEREYIDILGKSDKRIAQSQVPASEDGDSPRVFRPGHMKWDYAYSIGELRPDVVVEPFRDSYDEARVYLQDYEAVKINGHPMYFRIGSAEVLWSNLSAFR